MCIKMSAITSVENVGVSSKESLTSGSISNHIVKTDLMYAVYVIRDSKLQ